MNLHNLQSIDPVCLTKLDAVMANHQLAYRNITYHFCSAHCQERFSEAPVFFSAPRRIDEQHPIPEAVAQHLHATGRTLVEKRMGDKAWKLRGLDRSSMRFKLIPKIYYLAGWVPSN